MNNPSTLNQESSENQKMKVLNILLSHPQGLRTEEVDRICILSYNGVSRSDRYLRYLQEEGKVTGFKKEGDRTKTWIPNTVKFDSNGQMVMW